MSDRSQGTCCILLTLTQTADGWCHLLSQWQFAVGWLVGLFFSLQGCGKSVVAREFAAMLGYSVEPVMLYQVHGNVSRLLHFSAPYTSYGSVVSVVALPFESSESDS